MVLKKLGHDTEEAFTEVVSYLAAEEGLLVLVEPHELGGLLARRPDLDGSVDTYTDAEAASLADAVDFVVCLGGDGLVLHASSLFQRTIPPVISFNLGSLGFLTNHLISDFRSDLADVIAGREPLGACAPTAAASLTSVDGGAGRAGVHITLRMRLECQVVRAGQPEAKTYEVLNEVVLDRGSSPFLTKLECWERGRLVTKVQADGVMLATTTGSTAYSVAAGGSMVHPNVPAILFTPICPHSLSFRPVVLPDYAELELRVAGDMRSTAFVCFDGKGRQELARGDAVRVRMSTHPVPTISKADSTNDWFDTLNRCFGWNERLEQKPR
jgi:NAD+ kinase